MYWIEFRAGDVLTRRVVAGERSGFHSERRRAGDKCRRADIVDYTVASTMFLQVCCMFLSSGPKVDVNVYVTFVPGGSRGSAPTAIGTSAGQAALRKAEPSNCCSVRTFCLAETKHFTYLHAQLPRKAIPRIPPLFQRLATDGCLHPQSPSAMRYTRLPPTQCLQNILPLTTPRDLEPKSS